MAVVSITGRQMKRLQTLWHLFAKLPGNPGSGTTDREARIGWVAGAIGRQIGSCKELTAAEAATAIEALQKHLPPELVQRRPRQHSHGNAGRRGRAEKEARMADAGSLQLIANLTTALGWGRERFDAFLRSSKSPVRGGRIRTMAEANRVIWALKSLLRQRKSEASA